MNSLTEILNNTAIKDRPDCIGAMKSFSRILDFSYCSKFEKFPENVGNMKGLTELLLNNTAIKDLPDSIEDLESLEILDLSYCSKFEKFPENVGNMKSLMKLLLHNTAIKDLPDSIGDLESVWILDLSNCFKFEKFPENIGNMKSLTHLYLNNTAIKDLPDSIGDLESLRILGLSHCSKFEKFPENVGNMKSLTELLLNSTAVKDLPDGIEDLESLKILDLSNCSKFEKFPEMKRRTNNLRELNLRGTAIEEFPSSMHNLYGISILNVAECKNLRSLLKNISRLEFLDTLYLDGCSGSVLNLGKLDINHYKMAGHIPELPSSLNAIHAHNCRSKEEVWSLLWYCHLNWLRYAATQQDLWKYMRLSVVIPEITGGIYPEWIRYYDNLGSEVVTVELPMNWYEDPKFLGFVASCVYEPFDGVSVYREFIIHGNGYEFEEGRSFYCWCVGGDNLNDQVWVWWYPKMAIPKEHLHNNFTHFTASFRICTYKCQRVNIKKSGVSLIFVEDGI